MSSGNAGNFPESSRSICHLREIRELLREMSSGRNLLLRESSDV
jgi:hypothetical protein